MRYILLGALLLCSCGEKATTDPSSVSNQVAYSGTAMVMLDSSREFKAGTDIDLNNSMILSEGREIDFHLSDDSTVTLKGPVSGKLGSLLELDGTLEKWTQSAMDVLNKSANEGHVMTVRSAVITSEESWRPTAIQVPSDGNFCIATGTKPSFYVPGDTSSDLKFDVNSGTRKLSLTIPAGSNMEISWPDDLSLNGDVEFKNNAWFGSNKVSVIELDSFDFKALAKAGCTDQLEKFRQFTR